MTRREWTHEKDLPDGPWNDEPDKIQWIDEATGLDCLIVRNPMGALCGYVGVPPGHPWHGQDYNEMDVYVHGGLTFAAGCNENAPEGHGICHVPEPGRPENVWWLGFDCAHGGDLCPKVLEYGAFFTQHEGVPAEVYRDVAYVTGQCQQLAEQVRAAAMTGAVTS